LPPSPFAASLRAQQRIAAWTVCGLDSPSGPHTTSHGSPLAKSVHKRATEPETGEVIVSYTMLTQNCDQHPVLSPMHKPDLTLAESEWTGSSGCVARQMRPCSL
jgi:hypothetical protein